MSHIKNPIFVCAFFFLLSLFSAAAQTAKPAADSAAPSAAASPEATLQKYYDAMKAADFQKSAELVHPEELEQFRALFVPLFDAAEKKNMDADLLPLFKGASDVAALKKLSPAGLFASFLGGLTEVVPGMKAALTSINSTIIGSVPEGEVLHFVCRTKATVEGVDASKVEVISLKRDGGNWRVLLSEQMESMAKTLTQALAGGE